MNWFHISGHSNLPCGITFWHSDDVFKASIHIEWRWLGIHHWLCIFLPEFIK